MIELITPLNSILFSIAAVVFSIELMTLACNKTNTVRQLIIRKNLKPQIFKLLNPNWEISKIAWFTCNKDRFGGYEIYVEVKNNKTKQWTNDYIITDKKGTIIKERISYNIHRQDNW